MMTVYQEIYSEKLRKINNPHRLKLNKPKNNKKKRKIKVIKNQTLKVPPKLKTKNLLKLTTIQTNPPVINHRTFQQQPHKTLISIVLKTQSMNKRFKKRINKLKNNKQTRKKMIIKKRIKKNNSNFYQLKNQNYKNWLNINLKLKIKRKNHKNKKCIKHKKLKNKSNKKLKISNKHKINLKKRTNKMIK